MALTRGRNINFNNKGLGDKILGLSRNDCHVKATHNCTPLSISMVNRKISPDVKLAAVSSHEQGILHLHEILDCDRNVVCHNCLLYSIWSDARP
jgi:hypothetical protein